jgi:hypothetical protein
MGECGMETNNAVSRGIGDGPIAHLRVDFSRKIIKSWQERRSSQRIALIRLGTIAAGASRRVIAHSPAAKKAGWI